MDQDATWYEGRPQPRQHCFRWNPAPPMGHSPQFLAYVYCRQVPSVLWRCWLGGRKGIRPVKKWGDDGGGHWLVRMEWHPAGWSVCLPLLIFPRTIKSRSYVSSDSGPPGWSQKKGRKMVVVYGGGLLWPNGWMDQDASWYGGRPRPRPHCIRWWPSSPAPERGTAAPSFWPMSFVAKWSPISATAELLFTTLVCTLVMCNVSNSLCSMDFFYF